MIIEVAFFFIRQDALVEFEEAFAKAELVISQAEGYIGHSLQRCFEITNKYLLQVQWTTVEAHTMGFRQSELFAEWRSIIGPFFAEPPVVEHYTPL